MPGQGFADLHNHQFANLGFGGVEFFGVPSGPLQQALPWCTPAHGPGGVGDMAGWIMKTFIFQYPGAVLPGHKVGGWPQFDGWPRWDSVTHQMVHVDWLERAWQGGLRLMVMLAVNNAWMCNFPGMAKAPGRTCADMEAVDLQLDAAKALQAAVDQQAGGAGRGWYRIVTTAAEADAAISAGKLAVVLGIEVDYLFGSYLNSNLTGDQVKAAVQQYYDKGVRYVFPVHFADNAFGGTGFQNGLQAADVGFAPVTPFGTVQTPYVLATEDGQTLGYQYRGGRKNKQGLTDLGRVLLDELMSHGMIFDVDHMSYNTRSAVLDIAEATHYPVISGHSGFIDVLRADKRHEGQQTAAEVDRIRALGGMVAPIIAQGTLQQVATWTRPDGTSIPHVCGGSTNSYVQAYLYAVERMQGVNVAIGTDFNGFAGVPGPSSGPDACPGGSTAPNFHLAGLVYPFTSASGASLSRSQVGNKTFDIQEDGLVHVGMLPDFVAQLSAMGVTETELQPLLNSANSFVQLWSRAEQHNSPSGEHFYTVSAAERDNCVGNLGFHLEGTACYVFAAPPQGVQPFYRVYSNGIGRHFFTANLEERDNAISGLGFHSEGVACWVYGTSQMGASDLFRCFNPGTNDHFYTTSGAERDNAVAHLGYHAEGTACWVLTAPQQGATGLFRLLNPKSGEHFYTVSAAERDNCVGNLGFHLEGTACYVFAAPPQGVQPFYRVYSNGIGRHFFTANLEERDNAISGLGFHSEGVACWVYGTSQMGASDLFRCFNPGTNDHFYTTSGAERDNAVAHLGYHAEGTVCWVFTTAGQGTDLFRLFHP